jgi:hypothetical protein
MVVILPLCREFGRKRLRTATTSAVSLDACAAAAIRYLLTESGGAKAAASADRRSRCGRYNGRLALSRLTETSITRNVDGRGWLAWHRAGSVLSTTDGLVRMGLRLSCYHRVQPNSRGDEA